MKRYVRAVTLVNYAESKNDVGMKALMEHLL